MCITSATNLLFEALTHVNGKSLVKTLLLEEQTFLLSFRAMYSSRSWSVPKEDPHGHETWYQI